MKKQKLVHFRQGDVLIIKTNSIPEGAKVVPRDRGRVVLAYGETTGHSHSIAAPKATLREHDGASYLEIAEAMALLQHEEHGTIQIPEGKYIVRRQREYHPEEIRQVAD